MKAHARYQIILLGDRGITGVNNLPRVVAWQCTGRESNPRPSDHKSDALAITLPSHHKAVMGSGEQKEQTGEHWIQHTTFATETNATCSVQSIRGVSGAADTHTDTHTDAE